MILNCILVFIFIWAIAYILPNRSEGVDIEQAVIGNLFNKIGAIVLIFAFCIFIKVFSVYFLEFPPILQIGAGVALGLGMVISALKMICGRMKNFAEVLLGTGFGILFVATYSSTAYYNLISLPVASFIAILLLGLAYYIAGKCDSFATLLIGLLGGYANVFFMTSNGLFGHSNVSMNFIFSYLIFLNIFSMLYVFKNEEKSFLNLINIIISASAVFLFSFKTDMPLPFMPVLFWGIFVINDFLFLYFRKPYSNDMKVLTWINFVLLYLFSICLFGFNNYEMIGRIILSASFVYGLAAYYFKSEHYLYGFLSGILTADFYLFNDYTRLFAIGGETLLVSYLYGKNQKLKKWLISYLGILLACFAVKCTDMTVHYDYIGIPVWNEKSLIYAFVCGAVYFSAKIIRQYDEKLFKVFQAGYISLIYLWIMSEVTIALNLIHNLSCTYHIKGFSYIIIGYIYSLQMRLLSDENISLITKTTSDIVCFISTSALIILGLTSDVQIPFINIRLLSFAWAIAVLFYFGKINGKEIYKYAALLLGILLLSVEGKAVLDSINQSHLFFNTLSAIWIVYAGIIIVAGLYLKEKAYTGFGIVLTAISIIKIMAIDLINIEPMLKVIVFMLLGTALMSVSYIYNKFYSNK